jgi:VCBS repeat protein
MSTTSCAAHCSFRRLLLALLLCLGSSKAPAQRYLTTLGIVADLPAGPGARAIITGDFNGDGLTDLATIGERQISLHYQEAGSAGWHPGTLTVGKRIVAACSGRCNRDRLSDILLVTDDPPELLVYFAKAGERFVLAWRSKIPALYGNVLLADVDNDGRGDAVLFGKRQLGISVMGGRGDGSFRPGSTLLPESSFGALTVEDVNGDGLNDLVAANWVSNQLMVFTGFGKMNFSEPSVLQFATEPRLFSTASLDSDRNRDLVVCFPEEHRCGLFLGDGLGGFHPAQNVALNSPPIKLGVADVNGDGRDDVGLLSADERSLLIDLNNEGRLSDSVIYAAGKFPTDFCFIRHGWTSLIDAAVLDSATSRLRIFYNAMADRNPDGEKTYALGLHPEGLLAADVNHDGWDDIVVADSRSRSLSLFLNDGHGGFTGQISVGTSSELGSIEFVPKNDSIALFLGTGSETTKTSIVEINTRTYSRTVVGLPSQGDQTILSARVDSATRFLHLMILEHERAQASGEFIEYEQIGPARYIERSIASHLSPPILAATMCDCIRNGIADIVALVYGERLHDQLFYLLPGDSGETFHPPRHVLTMEGVQPATGLLWNEDLNNDGLTDLIVNFREPDNLLTVSLGQKDTTFSSAYFNVRSPVRLSSKERLRILDLNGDGIKDLVVMNDVDRSIEVYPGLGDGTFDPGPHLISTRGLAGFTLDDINGDRIPELIIADSESCVLKILSLEEGR